jgi:hypothetical protein
MKEISKKNLLSIIQESHFEMDEMAFDDQLQGIRAMRGKGPKAEKRGSKVQIEKPIHWLDDEKNFQSFYIQNPFQKPGEQIGVHLLRGGQTAEDILNNPKYDEWLENKVNPYLEGNRIVFIPVEEIFPRSGGKIPKWFRLSPVDSKGKPSPGWEKYTEYTGIPFRDTSKESIPLSTRDKLLRDFGPIVKKVLVNDTVNKKMVLSGFPPLDYPSQEPGHQKRHLDRYSEKENDNFQFTTFSVLPFRDYAAFAKNADMLMDMNDMPFDAVDTSVLGIKPEAMAYQFNKIRTNWSLNRKNYKKASRDLDFAKNPYTPIHKNERGGYKVEDQDYLVVNWLTITGKLYVNSSGKEKYVWTVEVKTEFGEKLREKEHAPIVPDKNFFKSVETPEIDKIIKDPNESVLQNPKVERALIEALQSVANQIMAHDPQPTLNDRIFKKRALTTKMVKLDENRINNIVNNIISQLKK